MTLVMTISSLDHREKRSRLNIHLLKVKDLNRIKLILRILKQMIELLPSPRSDGSSAQDSTDYEHELGVKSKQNVCT